MGVVPIIIFTAFWGVVGIVLPFLAPKGPNRGYVLKFRFDRTIN